MIYLYIIAAFCAGLFFGGLVVWQFLLGSGGVVGNLLRRKAPYTWNGMKYAYEHILGRLQAGDDVVALQAHSEDKIKGLHKSLAADYDAKAAGP